MVQLRWTLRRNGAKVAAGLLLLAVLWLASWDGMTHHSEAFHRGESDQVVSLQSTIGYLKRKLANQGGDYAILDGKVSKDDPTLPVIYVITPTYYRPVQKAELTRLCHTFLLVPNLHWVVVEDARAKTKLVTEHLQSCGVSFTHLFEPTPPDWKLQDGDKQWRKPRGVIQRNEGLSWIRGNAQPDSSGDGVVYFADDDNTYDLTLFEEMRNTHRVSVWPVALVGELLVEKPLLDGSANTVVGWNAKWSPRRPFAIDMAGFAVNLRLLLNRPKAKFSYEVKRGYQESEFLKHLVRLDELEPRSMDRVRVWHTRTEKVQLFQEQKLKKQGKPPSSHGMDGV